MPKQFLNHALAENKLAEWSAYLDTLAQAVLDTSGIAIYCKSCYDRNATYRAVA